jgi:glycosyltransferase involved in cell wall biosynthesis
MSDARPLVSVVVPVYNGERFLAAALESVCAQDYRPIEVIVVDDGSDDRTADVARSFEGVVYVRQPHQGPAVARNLGMALAQGEFVAFLDADDLMKPHKLSIQVGYLLDHPDIGCVLARQEILLEPGAKRPAWLRPDPVFGDLGGVPPLSAVVRRGVIGRMRGFDAAYPSAEGLEWLGRMREAGVRIAVLPEVLMCRRVHGSNLSHRNRALVQGLLRNLKSKIDRGRVSARMDRPGGGDR